MNVPKLLFQQKKGLIGYKLLLVQKEFMGLNYHVTLIFTVPGKVEYARVLLRGSHHFLLEWGRPLEENGNLTGYRIGYREGMSVKLKYDSKLKSSSH